MKKINKLLLTTIIFTLLSLNFNNLANAHDRWLTSSKPFAKIKDLVPVEFCVGHGFESEAAPSEWWLTDFYLLDPDGIVSKLEFNFDRDKQKSALSKFKANKEGIYMIYSVAENIYWVRTIDNKYIQFKDKIGIDKSQIKRTFIGWQYSKTFVRVGKAERGHYDRSVGGLIEIIPLKDPTNLKVGEYLPIKILSNGKNTNWNVGVVALYKGFKGEKWAYSYFSEYPGVIYIKEGIGKDPYFKIPIDKKGFWFIKAFRMMDKEVLCEKKYGEHDEYFFEATITFYVK